MTQSGKPSSEPSQQLALLPVVPLWGDFSFRPVVVLRLDKFPHPEVGQVLDLMRVHGHPLHNPCQPQWGEFSEAEVGSVACFKDLLSVRVVFCVIRGNAAEASSTRFHTFLRECSLPDPNPS